MTVLAAMQSAGRRLIGQSPMTFFGAQGNFEMELRDLVNEAARDIAAYRDWQALVRFAVVTGDGIASSFSLPADFDRQMVKSDMQQTSQWFWGFQRLTDVNEYARLLNGQFSPTPGAWIIFDNRLHFSPAPAFGAEATYPYITANIVKDSTGAGKPEFTADTDTFVLPERLLTLWLVWRWRENKKLDSTGDMEAFAKAIEEYGAKDAGSRRYTRNAHRVFPGTYPAWPGELGP
jgi:hypothetical protein